MTFNKIKPFGILGFFLITGFIPGEEIEYQTSFYEMQAANFWIDLSRIQINPMKGKSTLEYPSNESIIGVVDTSRNAFVDENMSEYFHVFRLINTSDDTLKLLGINRVPPFIQMASIGDNGWNPIEYCIHSTCLNSYHEIHIAPRDYGSFLIRRYTGALEAKLRVKFKVGTQSYFTNTFNGAVNEGQFERFLKVSRRDWQRSKYSGKWKENKIRWLMNHEFLED